jgi:NAD(P)-dependent dehydrogenase (short-subunit alcohol dehydrogenase family)
MVNAKRTAVITRATRGIGRSTAEVLAERGYNLALIDLQIPVETLKSVESFGVEALGYAGSVADELEVERFAQKVHERWAAADVLVNNAFYCPGRKYLSKRLSPRS